MKRWILSGGLVALMLITAAPATALGNELVLDPQSAPEAVSHLWSMADGPVAQAQNEGWLWGPAMRALTTEPYQESPNGQRSVFYFDKARMEITDPGRDAQSLWYVTAGLLVRDLIAGQIQVGDNAYIPAEPANIAVAGDLPTNPLSPTYAALRGVASIGEKIASNKSPNRVGQMVTDGLQVDGAIVPSAVPDSNVGIASYDDVLGHNIPKLFADWLARQPVAPMFLVGHPLTEPFWIDATVNGTPKRILMQAFERRVLTYTPDNPSEWKVEAGNVGIQYRQWLGLKAPADQGLTPLASEVPYGEIIIDRAAQHQIDPYLLAAVAKISSGYNPRFQSPDGREGFFGARGEFLGQNEYPLTPWVNADVAAQKLAEFHQQNNDWRAVLARYYTGSANPDWADPALNDFVTGVLNTQARLLSDLNHPPVKLASESPRTVLNVLGTGHAAYYSPSYSVGWWNDTLQRYASWGKAARGWAPDPNGYYCVRPGFIPGQRIELTANGVTLWCTVGDTVAAGDLATWQDRWVIELSWNTFQALGLDYHNLVEVRSP